MNKKYMVLGFAVCIFLIGNVRGAWYDDAVEDNITRYTEVDPGNAITLVNSSFMGFINMTNFNPTYVYKNYHVDGDFDFNFTLRLNDTYGTSTTTTILFGLSDDLNSTVNWTSGLAVYVSGEFNDAGGSSYIALSEAPILTTVEDEIMGSGADVVPAVSYAHLWRVDGNLTLEIYNDKDHTSLWNGTFITNQSNFSRMYILSNYEVSGIRTSWGSVSELYTAPIYNGSLSVTVQFENDQDYEFSQIASENETFNLNLTVDGNQNNTINFTLTDDLANYSRFIVNISNFTLQPNVSNLTQVYILSNSSLASGQYNGTINVSRMNDNNFSLIEVNITVSAQRGNVILMEGGDEVFSIATNKNTPITKIIDIQNDGNYNLSHCNFSFITSAPMFMICNISDFNVTNTTNSTASCLFTPSGTGSDDTASVKLTCTATSSGGIDTDALSGSIAISSSGDGGGDGGGIGEVCGEYTIYPTTKIGGYGAEGKRIGNFTLRIQNGDTPQYFYGTFSTELKQYCQLAEYPKSEIPANGIGSFVISCIAPEDTVDGHFVITTNTGCDDSRPISISSAGFWGIMATFISSLVDGNPNFSVLFEDGGFGIPFILIVVLAIIFIIVVLGMIL